MAFLKRKNPDERDFDDEDLSRVESRTKKLSKFTSETDSLERKKRKKEPPKPWTKKERYLILVTLSLTIISSSLLALSAREWKLPGFPRIKLPEMKINMFKSEPIIIEKYPVSPGLRVAGEKTLEDFKSRTKLLSGVYGLYVIDLDSKYSFGVESDELFDAASLVKLPAMALMFKKFEDGELSENEIYILKNEDKKTGAGILRLKPAGYEVSYKDLVSLMGKKSDNTAFNIVRNIVGDSAIVSTAREFGMTSFSLENFELSPKDAGEFFRNLYSGDLLSENSKKDIFSFLTQTDFEAWITAGVPDDIKVAHKYGRETHVVNDAGIVFTEKPYIVVIMSKGVIEAEADGVFPELSKLVYQNLLNY